MICAGERRWAKGGALGRKRPLTSNRICWFGATGNPGSGPRQCAEDHDLISEIGARQNKLLQPVPGRI